MVSGTLFLLISEAGRTARSPWCRRRWRSLDWKIPFATPGAPRRVPDTLPPDTLPPSRAVFPDIEHRGMVRRHFAEDLGDGLAYREGFSTDIAQAVVDHLVNDRGLAFDSEDVPDPGKIVFVYRKAVSAHPALHSDQSARHKIAA